MLPRGACALTQLTRALLGRVWLATHLRGQAGVAPGTQVALKFDDWPEEGHAEPAHLPSSPDCRVPLHTMDSSVLRESHAYCALLGGCGPAPPDAPVPSFAVPFICEVTLKHKLIDPSPDCTVAYERRFVYALALPRLGRSLFKVGQNHTPTPTQALKLGKLLVCVAHLLQPLVQRVPALTHRLSGARHQAPR